MNNLDSGNPQKRYKVIEANRNLNRFNTWKMKYKTKWNLIETLVNNTINAKNVYCNMKRGNFIDIFSITQIYGEFERLQTILQ